MNLPRTFLVSALVAVFALQLSGCSLIFSRSASPEQEEGDRETGVPAWLALSHRINEEPALEDRDLPVQEEDEEDGSQDRIAVQEPVEQDAETPPAAAPSAGDSAAAEPEQPAAGDDEIVPGTMAWIIEQRRKEQEAREALKKAAEEEDMEEDAEDDEKQWWEMDTDADKSFNYNKQESTN